MKILQNIYFSNLNAVPHIGGRFSIDAGGEWSLASAVRFAQNKFYYIKSGKCTVRIGEREYEGIPGRWFFIPSGAPHSYESDKSAPFSMLWMHFDISPTDADIFDLLSLPYFVDVPVGSPADAIFEKFVLAYGGSDIVDALHMKAFSMELLAEYVVIADRKNAAVSVSDDETLSKIISYIDENIDKSFTNAELAAICHLHPSHFIRVFKNKTGITPAKHVQNRKMAAAKRLVEETDLSIGEIMMRTGYIDACQFSKTFKAYFGRSPSLYRKKIRQMGEHADFARASAGID